MFRKTTEDNALTDGGLNDEARIVIDEIEEKNVDFLRLQFTDVLGTVKNVSIPTSQAEKAFTEGIYSGGSSIDGFMRVQESDMHLKPDPSTFAILPWRKKENDTTGHLICDVFNTSTGEPFNSDPRGVLKHTIERAGELGYGVNVAPEPEFFLFEGGEDGRATTVTNDTGGCFDLAPKGPASDIHRDIIYGLESMGFDIETSHHEVAEGQHEVNSMYDDVLSAADNVTTFRSAVRAVVAERDLHAAFILKPVSYINGSGIHAHILLFKDGGNVFHDGDDELGLSDAVRSFIVGVLDHTPAITAVADPTVSSYKRLVPDYEAPVYIAWSDRNRSALIHRPAVRTPAASRIRARFPNPSCNPYLAFTAPVRAGLDDIEKGPDCPDPVRENICEFNEAKREEYGIETLPKDLGGAVDALEENEVIQEAPGDHVFEEFVGAKRSEFKGYLVDASQWELDRYLETL